MRVSTLAISLAVAAGISPAAYAQNVSSSELAALRQQIAELQAKVAELEVRAEGQQEINVANKEEFDKLADNLPKVETKGGIKITSQDKKFEASLGGRIHFDTYAFDRDIAPVTGTTEFRRARLTLQGKALGWDYKMEQDFAAGTNPDGFRDVYIARKIGPGKLTIGHFKPYRSMEELTSSNEILMMERPLSSATGLYSGRQFQQGVGYRMSAPNYTIGGSLFNLRSASSTRNEGIGFAARGTWAPINDADNTLHFGLSYSNENSNQATPTLSAVANYAGRRGPSQTIASINAGSAKSVSVIGLEAAGAFGPAFFQAEYANADFRMPIGPSQKVDTWYVQGSWLLTGGHKPYKSDTGIFGSAAVPEGGAWELTARYDTIKNKRIANREASSAILGVNYYVTPNLRFMFNYTRGNNEVNNDKTNQYALRTQFAF
ncbi:porin [Lysobacter pythonis]|uniref:Porin n=1 Tax=Solilutibacter pythonis TaxID=2483112 RepID=A0A3M2I384_9GAMM|nr:porin [Lysobacter pythonis]RMH92957.1 porin [Lysobacter pythonis]